VFAGGQYLSQLWLFWVAPIAGAIAGGLIYRFLLEKKTGE
jgi:aquaporin Z